MTLEDLKLYNVRVSNGSGCLFQPVSEDAYTYILTAKHLFEGTKKDDNGNDESYSTADDTAISIFRLVNNGGIWSEEAIPFTLKRGETYFPSNNADAAILKIVYLPGYDKIFASELPKKLDSYSLYGFPQRLDKSPIGNKDTAYALLNLIGPAQNSFTAQLISTALNKDDISGMSGGGILGISDTYLSIIGVQSEMKHAQWANGQINFIPMKYFIDIISGTNGSLAQLYPPYMKNFGLLRLDIFKLEVDAIDENRVSATRTLLRNQALSIINSDITPVGIKELFKNRLLIDEDEHNCLSYKAIWTAWLEFLTIMNMIKYENIDSTTISDIFNSYRLKYSHTDDWTKLIPDGLSKSDYLGLKPDATIVVSSKNPPKRLSQLQKGRIIDITKVYDKSGFRTDRGMDPFTSFNFIHLDHFKTKSILNKLETYQNLDEEQLLEKLKQEYNDLFA